MGNNLCLCEQQTNMRPQVVIKGKNKELIELWGYLMNADSRAILLCLQIAGLEYQYKEVDMLKKEHQQDEFLSRFPSGTIPVLVEGNNIIYGTSQIQMTHICSRYEKASDKFFMNDYRDEINRLYATFDSKVRPVTQRIRRMVFAKKLKLKPAPTVEQLDQDFDELNERIIPMLNE